MPMSEEAKARLRGLAEEKRKAHPLAKDYELADWLVMADKVRDEHPGACDPPADYFTRGPHPGRTLKYVPNHVVEALAKLVPTVWVRYRVGPYSARTARVFPHDFITRLMRVLRLRPDKYTTYWNEAAQARCRVNPPAGHTT